MERSPRSKRTKAKSVAARVLPSACAGGRKAQARPGTWRPRRRSATSSSPSGEPGRGWRPRSDLLAGRLRREPDLAARDIQPQGQRRPQKRHKALRITVIVNSESADRLDDRIDPRFVSDPPVAAVAEPHNILSLRDPQNSVDLTLELRRAFVEAQL